MRTDLFDFELPEASIALHPVSPRDAARMLVVCPQGVQVLSDKNVRSLLDELTSADVLVFNDTRVVHSALEGRRSNRGEPVKIHINLHRRIDGATWHGFVRPARRLQVGDVIDFADAQGFRARVDAKRDGGDVTLAFSVSGAELDAALAEFGRMPLPPYIESKRRADARDETDYQTIYAQRDGAVAAPTAGLHFTPELFEALAAKGIARHFVTLHVGAGTFLPVKVDDTREHQMHAEWGEVSAQTAEALNAARANGGRIVAVGTTSLRILESAADDDGRIAAFSNDTSIFITPGYRFKAVDALMTNFHLPCSTLFMLVSAFSGLDVMKRAYAHAVTNGYRFYSYGDATLLYRDQDKLAKDYVETHERP